MSTKFLGWTWADLTDYPTELTARHYVLHHNGLPVSMHVASPDCPCKPTFFKDRRDYAGAWQHHEPKP